MTKKLTPMILLWAIAILALCISVLFGASPFAAQSPGETGIALIGLGGMIINNTTLTALARGFNAAFTAGFGSVTPSWQQVAMQIPSTSDAENYGWMNDLPGLREWIGQRVHLNLSATVVQLKNRKFEHTIAVKRDSIEDDRLGIYSNLFSVQGELAARHPDDLVWGLLPEGFNTPGFDGQPFFDADHASFNRQKQEVSWSNVQPGTGAPWFLADLSRSFMLPLILQMRSPAEFVTRTNPDDPHVFDHDEFVFGVRARYNAGFGFHQLMVGSMAELNVDNYNAARLALAQQFRPDGSPLGVRPTHLIVGPSNEAAARELLEAERNAAGATNIWRGSAELHVSPWLV